MPTIDPEDVLDQELLRNVTLDDRRVMQEIVRALIDDTVRQVKFLRAAIEERDAARCMRMAHRSKAASTDVGANALAGALKRIGQSAALGDFAACCFRLAQLEVEIARLRQLALSPGFQVEEAEQKKPSQ